MITIYDSTTAPAVMNAHRERLTDFCPTDTCLTCATRIDFHHQPTSILRFAGQYIYESRYRDIEHRFAQPATGKPFDVQIFDRNQAVSVNKFATFFVMKVATLVADVIVKSLEQQRSLSSSIGALCSARNTPLQAAEFGLCGSEPFWIFDLSSIAQRGEVVNAGVNADHIRIEGQRLDFAVNTEYGEPSVGLSLYCQSLDLAFERTVKLDPHVPNLRETQPISRDSVSDLSQCDAVITLCGSKARVSRLLAILHPTEKGTERKLDSFKHVLKGLRVYSGHVFAVRSNLFQLQILIEPGDGLAPHLPSIAPFLKRCVVKLATDGKLLAQNLFLSLCGIETVAISLNHLMAILSRRFSFGSREFVAAAQETK